MTALAAARNTKAKGEIVLQSYPVKDDAVIYKGAMVCLDAGYLKPAVTGTGLVIVGMAAESVDNTNGGDGGANCDVHEGCFLWANGESIVQSDVGSIAYAADDAGTVFTTSTGKSIAGAIKAVDSEGVWVVSSLELSLALA